MTIFSANIFLVPGTHCLAVQRATKRLADPPSHMEAEGMLLRSLCFLLILISDFLNKKSSDFNRDSLDFACVVLTPGVLSYCLFSKLFLVCMVTCRKFSLPTHLMRVLGVDRHQFLEFYSKRSLGNVRLSVLTGSGIAREM